MVDLEWRLPRALRLNSGAHKAVALFPKMLLYRLALVALITSTYISDTLRQDKDSTYNQEPSTIDLKARAFGVFFDKL